MKTPLKRIWNKKVIAKEIIKLFPPHKIYIELFFGAWWLFFNKPLARYNYLNDINSDVINCYKVMQDKQKKEKLLWLCDYTPLDENIFFEFKKTLLSETDEVLRSFKFLYLSNFSLFGVGTSLKMHQWNDRNELRKNIISCYNLLVKDNLKTRITFMNKNYLKILGSISFRNKKNKKKTLVYVDPPYLDVWNNYWEDFNKIEWGKSDVIKLLDYLKKYSDIWYKIAYSEFNDKFIIKEAEKRGFHINIIKERRNLWNRQTEILINNFNVNLLF